MNDHSTASVGLPGLAPSASIPAAPETAAPATSLSGPAPTPATPPATPLAPEAVKPEKPAKPAKAGKLAPADKAAKVAGRAARQAEHAAERAERATCVLQTSKITDRTGAAIARGRLVDLPKPRADRLIAAEKVRLATDEEIAAAPLPIVVLGDQ